MTGLDATFTAALTQAGLRARSHTLITTLRGLAGDRESHRVELDDGRRVKVRRLKTEERARRVAELLTRADDPAFAGVLTRRGRVLVEEWVDGEALDADADETHLCQAARILARVHAARIDPTVSAKSDPAEGWTRATAGELSYLASAGRISSAEHAALSSALEQDLPDAPGTGAIHTDFCGENMVLDAAGRVRLIDNEGLRIGPFALDLARTWYRWPLAREHWTDFCAAYWQGGGRADADRNRQFWRVAAVAKSARIRVRADEPSAAIPLRLLRELARTPAGA